MLAVLAALPAGAQQPLAVPPAPNGAADVTFMDSAWPDSESTAKLWSPGQWLAHPPMPRWPASGKLRHHLRAMLNPRTYGRQHGLGEPLVRESWNFHPYSFGYRMGYMQGAELIDDWLGTNSGYLLDFHLGWDADAYWGVETNLAYASLGVYDSARAVDAQRAADIEAGFDPDDPFLGRFDAGRQANLYQWDARVLYYPWGETRWRPYASIGLGIASMAFYDRMNRDYEKMVAMLPIALGVKYRLNNWLILRLEAADNITFGSGPVRAASNFSLTGGVEIRFGGARTAYWPWNPSRTYW